MTEIPISMIRFLACPECGGDLSSDANRLICCSCGKGFDVKDGIPVLCSAKTDLGHLHTEQDLAKMMKTSQGPRGEFSKGQWQSSKKEFWGMVREKIGPPPGVFLNIGCGYDNAFVEFEAKGYTFINFDIVHGMLCALKKDYGAQNCVNGDILSPPFKKGLFDYVICIDVLHHESDKASALFGLFHGLLKPGGILFLEDVNAWGVFQFLKSIVMPKAIYRSLRSLYNQVKRSTHRPADYEFPTDHWKMRKLLCAQGFEQIAVYPGYAYPSINRVGFGVYKILSRCQWVARHHNYHYMLSARKK